MTLPFFFSFPIKFFLMIKKMISFIFFLLIPSINVLAQTSSAYTAYQTSFPLVSSCPSGQYFDIALLQCSACPANATQKSSGNI